MNIQPANRIASVSEYYFSRKGKEIARLNAEGKDIISLAIGSPDMPPSKETIETLCNVAQQDNTHGYQPTVGIPELRQAMARFYKRWYDVDLDPKTEIQPLIGSKEGILHVTLALCNPGDKVLIPNPGYPTYTALNRLLGTKIVNYDLLEENGWQPDFDQLEAMDLSDVKIMWTNYPHMPTGGRATRQLYQKIVDFAHRHNIVVVNDNPYSFILNEGEHLSILQVPATNATFVEWILRVKSNIDSGTFRGLQLAAAKAYENSDEWHLQANVKTYQNRRRIAEAIMTRIGCKFDPQQTGMFLWGRIPDSYNDVEELTEKVLHEARVFITPGFIFGSNGKRYVRISLCAKDEKMEEALKRIEAVFK